jgi:hypothetical protein
MGFKGGGGAPRRTGRLTVARKINFSFDTVLVQGVPFKTQPNCNSKAYKFVRYFSVMARVAKCFTLPARSNVREGTQVLLVSTPHSHLQSFCVTAA